MLHGDPKKILEKSGNPPQAEAEWRLLEPLLSPSDLESPGAPHLLSLPGNSRFLTSFLLNHPEVFGRVVRSPFLLKPKGQDLKVHELQGLFSQEFDGTLSSAQRVLRRYKHEEMIRIVARDLAGLAPFEETGQELASLAGASLEMATEAAFRDLGDDGTLRRSFVTIGLGKLGGNDLNLSSDIDILYLYLPPEGSQGPAETRTRFESYATAAERITKILQERTEDGIVFRVDLNLRPEGKNGPIVNALEAILTYYEVAGTPWERAALTKAVPVAGNASLGGRFLKEIEPFVYRKSIDMEAIRELKNLKEKINQELKKSHPAGFHVKLGVGGIREIEFFLTAFQLVYGGKEIRLRERNTLKGLHLLKELRLVPPEEVDQMREAYLFLRRIENRLQMVEERQIHTLPTTPEEIKVLARQMGFTDADLFLEKLHQKTGQVASCFERLAP